MAWKSTSAYQSMNTEQKRDYDETRYREGLHKFVTHLRSCNGIHDRPSQKILEHLAYQGDEYDIDEIYENTKLRFPAFRDINCERCRQYGKKLNVDGVAYCCVGCVECVRENGWCWGKFLRPPLYGIPDPDPDTSDDWIKIPCNGITLRDTDRDEEEMTNLEVILMVLNEVWDTHPDHDEEQWPTWGEFFDKSPHHLDMIVCETIRSWTSPEIIREWGIDPGAYMHFQILYLDWSDEEYGSDSSLQPRELFLDEDSGRETRRKLCREGQAILDDGGEFNEEKYRQLCNLFMKIHQD